MIAAELKERLYCELVKLIGIWSSDSLPIVPQIRRLGTGTGRVHHTEALVGIKYVDNIRHRDYRFEIKIRI